MKKDLNKKVISLILSLLIIMSFNTGFSHADKNIIYDNPENLIEKISHPSLGEGMADGISPSKGDRSNSYAWTSAQLGDYMYIGSNRNLLTQPVLEMVLGNENSDLVLKIMDDLSEGDIPTGIRDEDAIDTDLEDDRARIFRYNIKEKNLEEIHISDYDTGYRAAVTFTPKGKSEASVYLGASGERSRVIRIGEDFKKGDEPEVVSVSDTGYSTTRAMATHEDSLCIGVFTTGENANLQILQSTDPKEGNWKEIASIDDFAQCNPRTDPMSVGQSGIWI